VEVVQEPAPKVSGNGKGMVGEKASSKDPMAVCALQWFLQIQLG
jgi:hypothetical protein